jgi:hypothetical protein
MLNFNGAWRFDSPGEIPEGVRSAFFDLIGRIAAQGDRQGILEHFKSSFGDASGTSTTWSSSASWAETDLHSYMDDAAKNAPLFIEAFYEACESLRRHNPQLGLPDLTRINRVLFENQAGYEIRPPDLVSLNPHVPVAVPERTASLDEQAQEIIQTSLKDSELLLSEGRTRQAVQEILWLLETVSTAFQGLDTDSGTIQGKYFNKIAANLRSHYKGQVLEQVLSWITTLHGYLSSPTGGGVRHGTDLGAGIVLRQNEARLFCNLIRSYITFLITEHERLTLNG